jgi:hypothetical protein
VTQVYTPQSQQVSAPAQQQRKHQGLSFLIHAPAKSGKSTTADSGPPPRLILDVENTAFWTPSRKVYWNPMTQQMPPVDGSWDSCIVLVRDVRTIERVYQILNSGQHPFNSLSVDSVTEMQQRIIDERVGIKKVERDDWGHLLRMVSSTVRQFRDLITHPVKPLWSVSFVAGTSEYKGKWRPMVQGQARDFLPYYVDLLGYIHANQDGTRDMLIGPHPQFETGERVGGRLPNVLRLAYPGKVQGWTIEDMLKQVLST